MSVSGLKNIDITRCFDSEFIQRTLPRILCSEEREIPYNILPDSGGFRRTYVDRKLLALLPRRSVNFDIERHSRILQRLLPRVDDCIINSLLEHVTPEKPLANLCHEDYWKNNMLLMYTTDGAPVDVRLVNVTTAWYSSPEINIAFFLFMNSSKEVKTVHWDNLLTIAITGHWLSPIQRRSLQQEMKLEVVFGYVHASLYLPLTMISP